METNKQKKRLEKNNAKRLLAGIALARFLPKAWGEEQACLASEDLAAFLDGQAVPVQDKERIISHLAECNSCYAEYIELAKISGLDGSHTRLGKDKFTLFKYLGSGFAVAAAVVLFINIYPWLVPDTVQEQSSRDGIFPQSNGKLQIMPAEPAEALAPKMMPDTESFGEGKGGINDRLAVRKNEKTMPVKTYKGKNVLDFVESASPAAQRRRSEDWNTAEHEVARGKEEVLALEVKVPENPGGYATLLVELKAMCTGEKKGDPGTLQENIKEAKMDYDDLSLKEQQHVAEIEQILKEKGAMKLQKLCDTLQYLESEAASKE